MPTGIGSRKVLTPRSSKVPRRSLPPQTKLIEAASFESFDSQPSSPDIMTTKLLEKVKNNKNNNNTNLNQRLKAASNTLAANSGRSKLSTEEFKVDGDDDEDLSEKYKKNGNFESKKETASVKTNTGSTSTSSASRPTTTGYNGNYNTSYNNSDRSYTSNTSNTSNKHNNPQISHQKPTSYAPLQDYNINNSYSYQNNNISNSSYERFNVSGESVELLQEQVSHLRREYEGLKQRFNELSRLRLSEPEEFLEEHKKLSEARDFAAEKAIKALQKENEVLKKQLEDAKKLNSSNVIVASESNKKTEDSDDSDEDFMSEIEKILKIYSNFTGLKITPVPENSLTQWHCEFSSRSGQFDFQLTFDSNLNKYQYVPLSKKNQLPDFLASDILITPDQMQLFFWRLLDTLSKQKN